MNEIAQAASTKTLLDEFMPAYDVAARYEIEIEAPASRVYETLLRHSLLDSPVARVLIALRSLPGYLSALARDIESQEFCVPTLGKIEGSDFFKLAAKPGEEIALGLIGQFWKLRGGLVRIKDQEHFVAFKEIGYAKATVNLLVMALNAHESRLSTETRVHATDAMSRRKFLRYWKIIAPFSGLLRRDMLKRVKQEAESEHFRFYS